MRDYTEYVLQEVKVNTLGRNESPELIISKKGSSLTETVKFSELFIDKDILALEHFKGLLYHRKESKNYLALTDLLNQIPVYLREVQENAREAHKQFKLVEKLDY